LQKEKECLTEQLKEKDDALMAMKSSKLQVESILATVQSKLEKAKEDACLLAAC